MEENELEYTSYTVVEGDIEKAPDKSIKDLAAEAYRMLARNSLVDTYKHCD